MIEKDKRTLDYYYRLAGWALVVKQISNAVLIDFANASPGNFHPQKDVLRIKHVPRLMEGIAQVFSKDAIGLGLDPYQAADIQEMFLPVYDSHIWKCDTDIKQYAVELLKDLLHKWESTQEETPEL